MILLLQTRGRQDIRSSGSIKKKRKSTMIYKKLIDYTIQRGGERERARRGDLS
jgi:hypothetical protein